ncbi:alkaline phosphatase family protein [Sphingomonas lutea]|uniref:Alkaline phosphatase n=1 Tax=Sphingomonas lutea TaxID=1045317 RepID=A0A7G9SF55_9SPHN|nr:alkaline phosphatase family protein [Sphingomonas lutea]QNN66480.1 alkaline phosphatase family protein [Sphingomonas lutea]
MPKLFLAAAALLAACAPPAAQAQGGPPKLLIVISVDQLSADLWDEYQPVFTGGFARIASGAVFRNGYQSHAATETCPGHSTILTGRRPATTGVVANIWFDGNAPRRDKKIYCAEDERAPGSTSTKYVVSPEHLRAPTLGDLLKQQTPASRNVAVAGKDRSAVMMGGRNVDQRWYPSGTRFVTDRTGAAVPASVTRANAFLARTIAAARPPLTPSPFCAGKARSFAIAGGGKPTGSGRLARAAGDASAFRASPEYDATVLALAAGLIQELRLGQGSATDLISIGLAGTDYVGHTYGSGGQEMCLQLTSLDRDLGDFLAALDRWGISYAVAMTADHGSLDIPERLRAKGVTDAAWIDPDLDSEALGPRIARETGLGGPIIAFGSTGDVFLDPALKGAARSKASNALLAFYRRHPQVHTVLTRDDIAKAPMPDGPPDRWSVTDRVRASFDPQRSGDLYVVLKPHIQPIADTRSDVSTHGSPWDYDRRVPVIFWRPGTPGAASDQPVETIDIMPTLAAMLGIAAGQVDGRCLAVPGASCGSR